MDDFITSFIATAGVSGNIHVWDTAIPDKPLVSVSCGSEVNALALTDSPRYLVAACSNGTLLSWPVDGTQLQTAEEASIRLAVEAESDQVSCVAAIPGSSKVVYGSTTGALKLISIAAGASPSLSFTGHTAMVLCCAVFSLGSQVLVASGSSDGTCRVWDAATGACRAVLAAEGVDGGGAAAAPSVNAVASVSLGGAELLVTGHGDNAVRVWDAAAAAAAGGAGVAPLATLMEHGDAVTSCTATAGQLVSCSMDASVKFWNWSGASGALDHSNYDFIKPVTKARAAVVDGKQILYALGEEGVVRGWDCDGYAQVIAVDVEVAEDDEDRVQLNDLVVLPAAPAPAS